MYFLGVDGGNTKTDYLLCKLDGTFVDMYRTGTCSHERFDDWFDGMERAMREQLAVIFERNKISVADISAAGFGLAGADLPYQIAELKNRVEKIGFQKYGLANDGILGVKGASEVGAGVCVINGTGTVVVGINEAGEILQVGGVGPLSGDNAGGTYIRDKIVALMYDFYFRCGEDSTMFDQVFKLLDVKLENLAELLSDYECLHKHMTEIIKIGAKAAMLGDTVAKRLFDDVGISIGKSAAGCIRRLGFEGTPENPVDIVQVGSIWHKIPYQGMNAAFLKTTRELSKKHIRLVKLQVPAAVGGVFWAKEIADGTAPSAEFLERFKTTGRVLKKLL